jgi:DNA-binding response OmpR family regulator
MSKRVLVVNDAVSHLNSLQLLTEVGYSVDVVHNSDLDLQPLKVQEYDLVILQESREAESFYLCERIRHLSHIPLMIISPNASTDTCVRAINAGADYFIRRPFGPLEFLARVQNLLHHAPVHQSAAVA